MIIVMIEITLKIMRVEVVLFNAKWSGKLTSIIKIIYTKEYNPSARNAFNNVACFWINQISSIICRPSLLVNFISRLVLNNYNITFLIFVPITKHVIDVEVAIVCIRRAYNDAILCLEVF